jgi:hypothetical protein
MKKNVRVFTIGVFLTLLVTVNAYGGGLMTMISTGDEYSQGMALAFLSASINNPGANIDPGRAYLVLCGDAYNLAVDKDMTVQVEPMQETLWEMVGTMVNEKGLNVYLCGLVFHNPPYSNLVDANSLRDGVKVITQNVTDPASQIHIGQVAQKMNQYDMQAISFGGRNR